MRVALLTSLERGGPLEQAIILAGELASRGVEVEAVCADRAVGERFERVGSRALVQPLTSLLDARSGVAIRRAIAGADVLHAHDRRSALWMRALGRILCIGSLIETIHGLPEPYLDPRTWGRRPSWRARIAYECVDATLCRRCDAIIVPSQAVARTLRERLGYPGKRMTVIPNGVGPSEARPPTGEALIGALALLGPIKGLDIFLGAAAQVSRTHPEVRFAIFGEGPEGPKLRALARELGLGDRLTMPGHVRREEAFARLGMLVVSSWNESSPMGLLEAMAAGVPVVATSVGGIPEIAVEGTAQLVPPGDPEALARAIKGLLEDPSRRERQVAAARARVADRYTASINAEAILSLYGDTLAARR